MTLRRSSLTVLAVLLLLAASAAIALASWLPEAAVGAFLYPSRVRVTVPPPQGCEEVTYGGEGVSLQGWRCPATREPRGTIVFLHGVASNRTPAAGLVRRCTSRGLDLIAYDSRAHGESGGGPCTYGYWEKVDLRHVLDTVEHGPIVLLGGSLGAAVALQEAADDPRVAGVVAGETFSDLRTVARERAPSFFTRGMIAKGFSIAEARAHFRVDDVSPMDAARRIRVPVLLIHGSEDRDTPPEHSRRVFDAIAGPKDFLLVPGAHHNESMRTAYVWERIDAWIERCLTDASHRISPSGGSTSKPTICIRRSALREVAGPGRRR